MEVVVVLLFSPKDFKDADLAHIPFEGDARIERTEYVSDPPLTYMMLVKTRVKNVAAFIGATLFRDCFQVSRQGIEYGNMAWDDECWYWNICSEGQEVPRMKRLEEIKPVTCVRQGGQVIEDAIVLVLQRNAQHVARLGDFVVKYM